MAVKVLKVIWVVLFGIMCYNVGHDYGAAKVIDRYVPSTVSPEINFLISIPYIIALLAIACIIYGLSKKKK